MLDAKLAFLLCTCSKFNSSFMSLMIKQYETSRTVATRHYFRFHIVLQEPSYGKFANKFAIKRVWFEFADSTDPILGVALQAHNNEVLSWEIPKIYNKLVEKNINLNANEIIGVLTLAALVKLYKGSGFKYIFIPVIIDYGRVSNMSHQTGLIIDYSGRFVFYEPYGGYKKHDKSYSECVCDFFEIFDKLNFFDTSSFESITYHKWLGLSDGIQNIILVKNNARAEQFEKSYVSIIEELKEFVPDYYDKSKKDPKDKTYKIVELLSDLDNLARQIPPEKMDSFMILANKVLELYYYYNSKTCVTITLIEMNDFFNSAQTDNFDTTAKKISLLHGEFDVAEPNKVLMDKLNKLLKLFYNSDDIADFVNKNYSSTQMCRKLY